MDACQLMDAG